MASYSTHKTGAEGKAQTLERKAARMGKRTGLYLPAAAQQHGMAAHA